MQLYAHFEGLDAAQTLNKPEAHQQQDGDCSTGWTIRREEGAHVSPHLQLQRARPGSLSSSASRSSPTRVKQETRRASTRARSLPPSRSSDASPAGKSPGPLSVKQEVTHLAQTTPRQQVRIQTAAAETAVSKQAAMAAMQPRDEESLVQQSQPPSARADADGAALAPSPRALHELGPVPHPLATVAYITDAAVFSEACGWEATPTDALGRCLSLANVGLLSMEQVESVCMPRCGRAGTQGAQLAAILECLCSAAPM